VASSQLTGEEAMISITFSTAIVLEILVVID